MRHRCSLPAGAAASFPLSFSALVVSCLPTPAWRAAAADAQLFSLSRAKYARPGRRTAAGPAVLAYAYAWAAGAAAEGGYLSRLQVGCDGAGQGREEEEAGKERGRGRAAVLLAHCWYCQQWMVLRLGRIQL